MLLALLMIGLNGCEKLIEVGVPVNQLTSSNVYTDSVTAQATVNGMYSVMYNTTGGGNVTASTFGTFVINCPARSADESYFPDSPDDFESNSLDPTNINSNSIWVSSYLSVYHANKIIEGMENSDLSATLKRQLIGEAKFIRAYCYYTLVNFFGDVPLVTKTDVQTNISMPRTPSDQVYALIIQDLKDAQSSLARDYSWSAGLRTRANYWSATAMLARVYLYQKEYALAETESSKVIANSTLFTMPTLSTTFLKASTETIWAFNTNQFGYPFITRAFLTGSTGEPGQPVTAQLVAAFERDLTRPEFEDDRFTAWLRRSPGGRYYSVKYQSSTAGANTEFAVVLRLAEQYLIRAEARIQQDKLTDGISDLNVVRTRAGLRGTPSTGKANLLLAVEHERQVELNMEFGHRWFDLKRTGRATAVLGPIKGQNWQSTDQLYPIPTVQITSNTNLTQNPGY